MSALNEIGWTPSYEDEFQSVSQGRPGLVPARVSSESRGRYEVLWEDGTAQAVLRSTSRQAAVGDWVVLERPEGDGVARIFAVLQRRTQLLRRRPGVRMEAQVIAANVDTVFLVTSLNKDFKVARIERYLTAIWDSGARPVVLLSKADLCDDAEPLLSEAARVAPGVEILAVSAHTGTGLEPLRALIPAQSTVAFVGSSGVGKSTLVNALFGHKVQEVLEVRGFDDRGRHTTTRRQLVRLPDGGLIIDTPGMRELALWDTEGGVDRVFPEVAELASECRFRDCTHQDEPGCAVVTALEAGELADDRLRSYRKLAREEDFLRRKKSALAAREGVQRWKKITKAMRVRRRIEETGS